ncbi:MAG TPA: hypothetical protein VFG51_02625 [Candidatus Saccharimonadia bacterium]|nr:hypothetical protein [Candidatus Saccharimonadia bacterium]
METTLFDILVVYSQRQADSASSRSPWTTKPFSQKSGNGIYNEVYAYFMRFCERQHLSVAFTTSKDIIGAGLCKNYWLYTKKGWTKVRRQAYAELIFDKVSLVNPKLTAAHDLLFSSEEVKSFISEDMRVLFLDKAKTHKTLGQLSIPTVSVKKHSRQGLEDALVALKTLIEQYPHQDDFSTEVILKDRFGAEGRNVFKFQPTQLNEMQNVLKKNPSTFFILQPFTKFDHGFTFQKMPVSADIRLIFLRGKMIQTYVRIAKKDNFLCNEHQGGLLRYTTESKLPQAVIAQANKIMGVLKYNDSLFSLDFVVSNNGNAYLLEGNTSPGIDWNPALQINIDKSKEFIRAIVYECARMVERSKIGSRRGSDEFKRNQLLIASS